MTTSIGCGIALGISLFFFFGSIAWGIYRYVHNLKCDETRLKYTILTPLQIAVIGTFLALVALFYPVYYYDFFSAESGVLKVLKSVALSIQHTLQVIVINTDFTIIRDLVGDAERVNKVLGAIYSLFASILFVLAPALVAGFILSLFKETTARIKYALSIGTNLYIFSQLNKISITLARDIKANAKGRKLIVFANVHKNDEDGDSELIAQAQRLGAILFKSDITGIGLKRRMKIDRKLYFISENEDDNISKALHVINNCFKEKNLNSEKTEFYVFADSVESEMLLNSTDIGNMKVRRVNDNKNLAWHTLRRHSIFDDAVCTENGEKELNIVIVGCGNYGAELTKAICWLGQLPGHRLNLHVFDKDKDVEEKMRYLAPELIKRSGIEEQGEAYYNIRFYPDTDVTGAQFINKLNTLGRVTTAFVTLGSDELNIDTAIRMRMEFIRNGYGEAQPSIYPVVYSSIRSEIAEDGSKLLISSKDKVKSYNLKFIGAMDKRYSMENIEQEELENKAKNYHLHWSKLSNNPEKIKADTAKFNKYEYYRSSSMAQAIYNEYLVKLIKSMAEEGGAFTTEHIILFNRHEHLRWNAYMRAEGYVYCKNRDDLAKMHCDLRSFDALTYDDKQKDDVWQLALSLETPDN